MNTPAKTSHEAPWTRLRRAAVPVFGAAALASTSAEGAAAANAARGASYADLSLEQLMDLKIERVYGASRHEQKVTHAPSAVSIVTAEEIKQHGWRTLGEVLRRVRGLYVADDRNYSYLGLRGFQRPGDYNTRVLVLIDGHRMNDNVYHSAYLGRDALTPDLIERIEVIRGPSSSVYGSSAFFGVINVVTRRPAPTGEGEVAIAAGNLGTYEGRLTLLRGFKNGVEWTVSGSYYTSAGESAVYFPEFDPRRSANPAAANGGVAENLDGERAAQAFTKLAYRALTLTAFASRRVKEVPTASFGTVFNHPGEETIDRRGYVDLKLHQKLGASETQMVGRVFYDQYRYSGAYPFDYALPGNPPDIIATADGARGEWAGTEWLFKVPLSPQHAVMTGLEYRHSFHADQFDNSAPGAPFRDERESDELGVFAQWDGTLRKDMRVSAGVRHDHYYQGFGGTTNPRIAVIYSPTEATAVKLLHGRAFRAPNPYESYYYAAQPSRPALRPEKITTTEIVFERYWGASYRLNLSGYRYRVDRLISQQEDPVAGLFFENADETETRGAELELEAKHDRGWRTRASYAWQRSRDRLTGSELSSSPRGLAKLNAAWNGKGGFTVGAEAQHQSGVRTLTGGRVRAFTIANLHVSAATPIPGCDIAATVSNIFDRRTVYPGAGDHTQEEIPQPGRTIQCRVTWRF